MKKNENTGHRETLERYCHVIGANTIINRLTKDGSVSYECVNSALCANSGGCRNDRYAKCRANDPSVT